LIRLRSGVCPQQQNREKHAEYREKQRIFFHGGFSGKSVILKEGNRL